MSVRTKDSIDQKLTKIYNDKVTVNLDTNSSLSPDDFWNTMEMIATMNKCFVDFVNK